MKKKYSNFTNFLCQKKKKKIEYLGKNDITLKFSIVSIFSPKHLFIKKIYYKRREC